MIGVVCAALLARLTSGFVRPLRHTAAIRPLLATQAADERVLSVLGDSGRAVLSPSEEDELLQALSALPKSTVSADAIDGSWRLLYTSKSKFDARNPLGRRVDGTAPGIEAIFDKLFSSDQVAQASSSPIQRALTSVSGVVIQQNVQLQGADPRVDQLVSVGDGIRLRLSAAAAFDPDSGRIDFTFDLAYFDLFGVRFPYPVPFRLLGDEARGWLDTSYVSNRLRVSTGNKGTTFILSRHDSDPVP